MKNKSFPDRFFLFWAVDGIKCGILSCASWTFRKGRLVDSPNPMLHNNPRIITFATMNENSQELFLV